MYLWIKAFHIISVVAWFAGLFYIFRLFVYHTKHKEQKSITDLLEVMEGKLLRIIIGPASVCSLAFGLTMLYLNPGLVKLPWFHAKLVGVVLLFAYQHLATHTQKRFFKKDFYLSEKSCRLINEIPTLCLFLIVIMVVVKPFV